MFLKKATKLWQNLSVLLKKLLRVRWCFDSFEMLEIQRLVCFTFVQPLTGQTWANFQASQRNQNIISLISFFLWRQKQNLENSSTFSAFLKNINFRSYEVFQYMYVPYDFLITYFSTSISMSIVQRLYLFTEPEGMCKPHYDFSPLAN